jgi:ABC-type uncharacterized transport system substrate-binding protein
MLHVTCDQCGKELRPGEDQRYVVKMEAYPVDDPAQITDDDLELLKQLAPRIARVAVVSIAENPLWDGIIEGMKQAAPTLGMDTELLRLTGPGQIDEALDSVVGRRADALVVLEDPVLRDNAAHFIEFARKRGIPALRTDGWAIGGARGRDLTSHF